ncbi:murein L,D-transpeptidase [Asticcacaulis sp. BYS171W]|uniref:Murein L,D-transpeptidase n=1 Tax=Asticcacaulis aquaticus TaxID=2984212 RepID=A0ABT5HPG8_9CAUL|nr:murein L,D-transpeptidase family protein [Asticcacaulis aquaticus]MDC7681879.1 murein L,D-transpeptidase [Asticcacaulis aquaticus]
MKRLGVWLALVLVLAGGLWLVRPWQTGAADLTRVRAARMESIRADMTRAGLTVGSPILIRIFKESDELELWVKSGATYKLYKTFKICAWSGKLGPKQKEGDGQAPEGFYTVARPQMKPDSQYHLAFNLGFPNAYDRANGYTGSFLMVHGNCASIGCYAMTDRGIEEIWLLADESLKGGQAAFQVHSFPFRMTDANMQRHARSEWIDFWRTLKVGYDVFEDRPDDLRVRVDKGAYEVRPAAVKVCGGCSSPTS